VPDRLAAIAHPLRDRVLFEYRYGPASPSEVAERTGLALNTVSYHTRVLAANGYLALVRTERRRGALVSYYRATAAQDIEDDDWLGLVVQRRRRLVLDTLSRAAAEVDRAAVSGAFEVPHWHLSRAPAELDDEGLRAVSELLRRTAEEVAAIAGAGRERVADRRGYRVVLMGFELGAPPGPQHP
jgi:DNA-binding transcriptional ArsR family regulator